MEKIILVLCIAALSVSTMDGYVEFAGVDLPGFTPEEGGGGEMSTIESVTVPESKIKESVHYDHFIKIEVSWENKSSGEYYFWALDVTGQELIRMLGTKTRPDGYGEEHKVLHLRRELGAGFTVYSDSSDGESMSSTGSYDVERDEYTDLNLDEDERKLILTETNANISVDELPSIDIPLDFYGYKKDFFYPNEKKTETLEESVLGDDRTVELGDDGIYMYEMEYWDIPYHWVAERGIKIAGYDTLFINVTSDLGVENFSLPFVQYMWFANEVSVPVKQYIRTNNSWVGEEESFYYLIENTFTLQEKGFKEGTEQIPWGNCDGEHWREEHKSVETDFWIENYMPTSGSNFEESSFDFRTEDAIDFLTSKDPVTNEYPSIDLVDFLSEYDDAIVMRATYAADKDLVDPKTGEYWWNLTFGHKRDSDEWGSDKPYRYQVLVKQTTTREGVVNPEYVNTFELEEDFGLKNGSSPLSPDDISPRTGQTVTIASSEEIFKSDDKVREFFYTTLAGVEREELDWGDGDGTQYILQTSGWEAIGMDLIGALTGIESQTSEEYYWEMSREDLLARGTLSSASLDAQTGRLISIMFIDGTALQGAFSD